MKVLWLVNIIMPEACEYFGVPSNHTGGWLVGAKKGIIDQLDGLTILTTYGGSLLQHCTIENTEYYLVPQNNAKEHFREILENSEFEVIHIFGTELAHFESMVSICDLKKTIVSIQGITSIYVDHFLDGIPPRYCKKSYLRSILSKCLHAEKPVYDLYLGFKQMAERENGSVGKITNFAGRTRFDKAFVWQSNPKAHYYHINETLRDSFYCEDTWDIDKCDKHTIFIPQAHYPIKGLHVFIKSLYYVKQAIPDIKVYIAGPGINLTPRTGLRKVKDNFFLGYFSYCKSMINEYDLQDCFAFTGPLNESQMKERLLQSNVFVLPSLIENSPNSLGEAMLLGVPCVATYVGGIPDMLQDGQDGILCHSTDAHLLADAIVRVINNPELATRFSINGKERAKKTFNRKKNAEALLGSYKQIQKRCSAEQE